MLLEVTGWESPFGAIRCIEPGAKAPSKRGHRVARAKARAYLRDNNRNTKTNNNRNNGNNGKE
jgi:hypothetical protein